MVRGGKLKYLIKIIIDRHQILQRIMYLVRIYLYNICLYRY